jgi:PHD/YefM family antitoxin component YafN of YafNO toxin-antitoxin module
MLTAHQQITDETGQSFVLVPSDEYEKILEDAWHREAMLKGRNEESISITLEELKAQLGHTE